jgi:AraC family transcriptional regulator of adaptative response / DNA-3-methyladenine glycosylase II
VIDDPDRCYLGACSRDPRFDGWFIVAVTSTGIYCRPSCPARTPARRNVRFFATAAAAQAAGFRSCKRCRPDAAPGSPEWNVRGDTVARAMRLIADGVVDRDGVTGLAARLGYSTATSTGSSPPRSGPGRSRWRARNGPRPPAP